MSQECASTDYSSQVVAITEAVVVLVLVVVAVVAAAARVAAGLAPIAAVARGILSPNQTLRNDE